MLLELAETSWASPVETFGSGACSIGMGGGGVAYPRDSGAIFLNPASIFSLSGEHRLLVGFALVRSHFQSFPDLWWDTNQDGLLNEDDTPLQWQPDYESGDGVHAATVQKIGGRLALGLGFFLPVNRLLLLSTFEPELPIYFMYDSRLQRYDFSGGLAFDLGLGLNLGAGVRMIPHARYHIATTIDLTVTAADEDDQNALELITDVEMDVHEMSLDLGWGFAPLIGLQWDLGEAASALHGLSLAATWRGSTGLPVDVDAELQGNFTIQDLGELQDTIIPMVVDLGLSVYDHYMPEQVVLGIAYSGLPHVSAYADLRWTRWQQLSVNITRLAYTTLETPFWELDPDAVQDGNDYTPLMRNTWSWRLGGELVFPEVPLKGAMKSLLFVLRAGGGVEFTPLVSQTSDTSLLDSDRLVLAMGAGMQHHDPLDLLGTIHWDVFAQVHKLADGTYSRKSGDSPIEGYPRETDDDGNVVIDIGGSLWTAGLQMGLDY